MPWSSSARVLPSNSGADSKAAYGPILGSCHGRGRGYGGDPMVEPGLVTLAKIVGTLLLAMGVIPFLFLLSPGGDKSEPKDNFDDLI
jgi:hypothetical protein